MVGNYHYGRMARKENTKKTVILAWACADLGLFVWGWGGVRGPGWTATSFFFFSPHISLTVHIKLNFPKDSEGVHHFPGGGGGGGGGWGPTFSKGGGGGSAIPGEVVQMLDTIENHITYDFPGGVLYPYPPSGSAHDGNLLRVAV